MDPIRIAIVGMGKIARDQHVPAIRGNSAFSLAATVSPHDAGLDGVPHLASLDALLHDGPAVDAIALCTPPQVRYDLAAQALGRGIHMFLEKPPGATLAEVGALQAQADKVGVSLFAAWHSRFAAGVAPARARLPALSRQSPRLPLTRLSCRVPHDVMVATVCAPMGSRMGARCSYRRTRMGVKAERFPARSFARTLQSYVPNAGSVTVCCVAAIHASITGDSKVT